MNLRFEPFFAAMFKDTSTKEGSILIVAFQAEYIVGYISTTKPSVVRVQLFFFFLIKKRTFIKIILQRRDMLMVLLILSLFIFYARVFCVRKTCISDRGKMRRSKYQVASSCQMSPIEIKRLCIKHFSRIISFFYGLRLCFFLFCLSFYFVVLIYLSLPSYTCFELTYSLRIIRMYHNLDIEVQNATIDVLSKTVNKILKVWSFP